MERKPKTSMRLSFFKILIKDDYTRRLSLPHVFVKKYIKCLPGNVKLRTSCGETWDVKLEEEITDDEERYLFFIGGGWSKFAKDLELNFGEFLVFWFNVDDSTFDVSVYGTHCCERQIPAMAVGSNANYEDSKFMNVNLIGIKSFAAVIQKHNRHFLDIPKAFAVETGIITKRAIKLENEEGKQWAVELPIIKGTGRIRMSTGWRKFFVENKVVPGSQCRFEFDATSGNLIMKNQWDSTDIKSSKRKRGFSRERMTVPAKRGRGRPPKDCIVIPTSSVMNLLDDDEDDSHEFKKYCHNSVADVANKRRRSKPRNDGAGTSMEENRSPLYFEIVLKSHHRSRISLPNRFWKAAGLKGKKALGVEYESQAKNHRQWVVLDCRDAYRIDMASGWPEFRKANGLVYGNTYSFEYKPSRNVVKVMEVSEGN